MPTYQNIQQDNKSRSAAGETQGQYIKNNMPVVSGNNQPGILHQMANSSSSVKQLRTVQAMADKYIAEKKQQKDLKQSPAATSNAPIQAKLGFEFETGWLVDRIPFDYTHDDVELPKKEPEPFKKMQVVTNKKYDGFRMEADEAEGGRSEIEFVIRPAVDESVEGLKTLTGIMKEMTGVGEGLVSNRDGRKSWPLSEVTKEPFDDFTLVTPGDEELKAGIQPTMGLKLEAIPHFLQNSEKLSETPKFNGLLNLISRYINTGSQNEEGNERPLAYPKMLAEPLLARTDFSGLLNLVKESESKALEKFDSAEAWVNGVLELTKLTQYKNKALIDRNIITGDQDVYSDKHLQKRQKQLQKTLASQEVDDAYLDKQEGYKKINHINEKKTSFFSYSNSDKKKELEIAHNEFNQFTGLLLKKELKVAVIEEEIEQLDQELRNMVYKPGLTVAAWLAGIWNGSDALTGIKDAESMGQFGKRTEAVGPEGKEQGGIFEFRGIQASKTPVKQWGNVAIEFFENILKLHGH